MILKNHIIDDMICIQRKKDDVWGQTPLKFYKVGKQKEKICIS